MFRGMRRFKQQITEAECKEILSNEKRGVLSLLGDDGYPYGLPLSHLYCEEDGKIYFHGAKEGHKIDAIKNYDKASFCVYDKGYKKEGDWALNITSVITFGRIHLVEDEETALKICSELTDIELDEDHIRLYNALLNCSGKFLISYNDCDEIRKLWDKPNIYIESISRMNNLGVCNNGKKEFDELFISNYDTKGAAQQLSIFES